MLTPNSPRAPRRSWPYAITAILVLALQEGWDEASVIKLAAVLLVLLALINSNDNNNRNDNSNDNGNK
ncbi:hypothetical protein OHA57_00050 [Streptomyces anulatus]|uniref:hypothetical protein n=1 Tax=Streptomyces anulatus TaxID=1892 RepID=UPI002DDBC2F4|nr:hypothetical protein [Streptomyces anulatus]WSC59221.1 hypothetical protein OHA57_00050 [Streptomyces anulatus]